MTKNQKRGLILIATILAAYMVLALVIPFNRSPGYWVGFAFGIIGIFVGAIGIMIAFHGTESVRSKFYGFPVARIALIYALVQVLVSFVLMGTAFILPAWIGVVTCILLLVVALVGFIAADVTRDEIERQDAVQK